MITNNDAIFELSSKYHPNIGIYISGESESDLSGVMLENGATLAFTFNDVLAKKTELQNAEPMVLLRQERNRLLLETDWMSLSDSPTMSTEWQTYRQALRDLPANSTPSLDENGNLTGVTWPTKPS